jgi:hypothetical protein
MDVRANGPACGVKGLAVFILVQLGPHAQRAKKFTRFRDAERVNERLFDPG